MSGDSLFIYLIRGRWGSDTTERLHFHFSLSRIGEGTHSSILAWRIPGTGESGGLPSMGSHRVGHDWSDLAAAARLFRTQVFPVSGGMRQREKRYNFTHRSKSLNCFKPSVTRKSAPLYLKTQIKSQQYVRQQIMKLVITFSSLLNPMQLISFFVVLAQWPITSVKAIISKKLMKFLWMSVRPVPQSRCPDHWRLWEAHFNHFFYSEILILKPGKALSNKNEVCQGAGKSQAAILHLS